jgi:DNA-binding transcriptional ArsR family regulator
VDVSTEPLNRVFAALADPTRRDLVARLASADATVGELAEPHDMSLQAISKHVKALEEAGLVTAARTPSAGRCTWTQRLFDL